MIERGKMSDKRVKTLSKSITNKNIQIKSPKKDLMSQLVGKRDFQKFQAEKESNFLTSSNSLQKHFTIC